ncbi:hypothetical protein ACFX10_010946 [Malus domestica]
MLKHFQLGRWTVLVSSPPKSPFSPNATTITSSSSESAATRYFSTCRASAFNVNAFRPRGLSTRCAARRRVLRYDDDEDDDEDVEYGHNKEIAVLELYSQSVRGEALIVHALVDDQDVEVLIFKGFSSSLSYGTSPDPSKSILPERAVIKAIDRVKGPFDPSNIEYLQKGLTWEAFKSTTLPPNLQLPI